MWKYWSIFIAYITILYFGLLINLYLLIDWYFIGGYIYFWNLLSLMFCCMCGVVTIDTLIANKRYFK